MLLYGATAKAVLIVIDVYTVLNFYKRVKIWLTLHRKKQVKTPLIF